jgi:putative ABC transport system permease protein
MALSEIIRIAWEGLVSNKLRSMLTMLGVIIGVAAVIIMIAVSAGTEATIADQIKSLGTNLLFVSQSFSMGGPGARPGEGSSNFLSYDDALAIGNDLSGITGVVIDRNSTQSVKVGGTSVDEVEIVGTTPDFPGVRGVPVSKGRFFNQSDMERKAKVAVLGYSLAEQLFGEMDPIGNKVLVGNVTLSVVGVLAEKGVVGNTDYDARLYTPITVVFQRFTPSQFSRVIGDRVNSIVVQVENQDQIDNVIFQIQLLLAKRHDTTLDELPFTVRTQQDIITTQESTTAAFRSLLAWVAAVSLVVGGIGIMNIMFVSVTERTREIGIRQAVGATPNDIRMQFLTEALMLSLVGGLMGVVTGVGGSWIFDALGDMRTVVVPSSILLAFISAAGVGIFFGYYPANKAAQLDPIEALHYE